MKPFAIGTKVEVLYSAGDSAPDWTPATVVNIVKPVPGFERHGCFSGNIVVLENGKQVEVTEPGMIIEAE